MSCRNQRKLRSFYVPTKKEIRKIGKDGNETVETISYKIKLFDSARFMASSLSSIVGNLMEGIRKIKGKECDYFFEYESVKDNLIKYKCLSSYKDHSNKFGEEF